MKEFLRHIELLKSTGLSRREFLKLAAIVGFGALAAGTGEGGYLIHLWNKEFEDIKTDWEKAHSYDSPETFLKENKEWLKRIELGFNISPEHLEWVFRPDRPDTYGATNPTASEIIATITQNLGLRSGRLGLRMDRTLTTNLEIDLTYYEPWLTEFDKQRANLTINTGIKVFRWPEVHVAKDLLTTLYKRKIPGHGHEIDTYDPLGKFTLTHYYPQLYKAITKLQETKSYQPDLISKIQPENEGRFNFGEFGWKLSRDYLIQAINLSSSWFPNATILQNCALHQIQETTDILTQSQNYNPNSHYELALNYYFQSPHPEILSMAVDDEKLFDGLAMTHMLHQVIGKLSDQKDLLRSRGIAFGMTELQMEPWGDYQKPGNDFQMFLYSLIRTRKILGPFDQNKKTQVLLWGTEELLFNLGNTKDTNHKHHKYIRKLIRGINSLSP